MNNRGEIEMLMKILLGLVILSVVVPIAIFNVNGKKNAKQCLMMNLISFFSIFGIGSLFMLGSGAVALAETTTQVVGASATVGEGLKFIGAALATGLSGIGGGIAVSSSASAAIGAMSENEKIMGKTLIFVALAEGIALYGLIISFMILG